MVVFLGYYSPENYNLLLKTADDRKKLDDKWQDWVLNFIKAKTQLEREYTVEEFHVDVKKMNEYFKAGKLKNNGANRASYISKIGAQEYERRNAN